MREIDKFVLTRYFVLPCVPYHLHYHLKAEVNRHAYFQMAISVQKFINLWTDLTNHTALKKNLILSPEKNISKETARKKNSEFTFKNWIIENRALQLTIIMPISHNHHMTSAGNFKKNNFIFKLQKMKNGIQFEQ